MKKLFFSLLVDSLFIMLAIEGLYNGMEWARNILLFCVWVSCVNWLSSDLQKNIERLAGDKNFSDETKGILYQTEVGAVLIVVFMLASVGRWFSAIAMLFTLSFRWKVKDQVATLRKERAAAAAKEGAK